MDKTERAQRRLFFSSNFILPSHSLSHLCRLSFPRLSARSFSTMHLLAVLAGIALLIECVSAACECGYLDPQTGALWTDASLSYFNDTSAYSQVIFSPLKSPSASGQRTAGDTGDGTQLWSATSFVNQWERDFGVSRGGFRSCMYALS